MRPRAIAPVALLALSCSASAPPPRPLHSSASVDAGTPAAVTPAVAPPPPDALRAVTATLPGLEPVSADAAPWIPSTALRAGGVHLREQDLLIRQDQFGGDAARRQAKGGGAQIAHRLGQIGIAGRHLAEFHQLEAGRHITRLQRLRSRRLIIAAHQVLTERG